ncbi:acyl-CoA carboxylase subunit beta [Mobilicoccus pelagius]|uniref:Na(+)-transporting methylmalonyl-CoA decarboxylase alpha subunit n=2 Tax=Mobilicoccus TaxID=984996 RepID=H5UR30_9MICO|nr:acyl-CoA carboxylase subunit beta [Mobilicoccus pelagius]GAB48188.1 Na(+)-transporting methylmalonyl-CoA decarboxylase alpha subunit [Mobilicoccus pelagius NBRC 104925]
MSREHQEELQRRREHAMAGGGESAQEKRRNRGLLTARERLDRLFQRGTFQESGLHVRHDCRELGEKVLAADGVVTGTGYVDGGLVAAFAQDATVAAGTLGHAHAKKIVELTNKAIRFGVPVVAFQESGGARIQEGVDALSGYGEVFYQNVLMSGVVPQIAVICGPCAGGAAYSPALMDFIVMTRENAQMFITGPEVIRAVTGRSTTAEEIGGAEMHASVSGNVHFLAEDDDHAVEIVRELLSYLPPNNTEDPPHDLRNDLRLDRDERMNDVVPDDPSMPMDVREVITRLVDGGRLLEVQAEFAKNLIVGFARIEGMVVGLVANQPTHLAGALDIDASDKGARFVRFCNAFNIPLVTLVDVPGFLPGIEQERGGIIRHGAKMLFAYASGTVPKFTVILRKAYGGSYLAMCSKEMGTDAVYAWPGAEIAVMGGAGAVNILYRRELAEAEDKEATRAELIERYRREHSTPYRSAARGYITDVIDPAETRATLALGLRKSLTKRELRPAKKHGNIPL